MEETLKSPREWARETGIEILDADGWRGRTGRAFTDEISEEEFRYRASFSTIRTTTRAVYVESTEEALEEALEDLTEVPLPSDEEGGESA